MNYSGFDMYAHNRATRQYARTSAVDLTLPQSIVCPFCDKHTTEQEGRIAEHIEHGGFTRCPASGLQLVLAAQRAASLTANYMLASEALWDE